MSSMRRFRPSPFEFREQRFDPEILDIIRNIQDLTTNHFNDQKNMLVVFPMYFLRFHPVADIMVQPVKNPLGMIFHALEVRIFDAHHSSCKLKFWFFTCSTISGGKSVNSRACSRCKCSMKWVVRL
jgi:hypothetical protein